MSSEESFKAIRITLSEEAFDIMEKIMKDSSFRSYSSTIEESIRVLSDIINEIHTIAGERDENDVLISDAQCAEAFARIGVRLYRFTGRRPLYPKK